MEITSNREVREGSQEEVAFEAFGLASMALRAERLDLSKGSSGGVELSSPETQSSDV